MGRFGWFRSGANRDVLAVSPEKMRETKVVWTMVGCKTVY